MFSCYSTSKTKLCQIQSVWKSSSMPYLAAGLRGWRWTAWGCRGHYQWGTYHRSASLARGSRRSPSLEHSCPSRPHTGSDRDRWAGPGTRVQTANTGRPGCRRGNAWPGGAPSCPLAAWPLPWSHGQGGWAVSSSCSQHCGRGAGPLVCPHTGAAWCRSGHCGSCPIASYSSRTRLPPRR